MIIYKSCFLIIFCFPIVSRSETCGRKTETCGRRSEACERKSETCDRQQCKQSTTKSESCECQNWNNSLKNNPWYIKHFDSCTNDVKEEYIEECSKENKVDLDTLIRKESEPFQCIINNHNCYVACLFKKIQLMNDCGEFNEENIPLGERVLTARSRKKVKLAKTIDECKEEDVTCACELAACVMKKFLY